MTDTEQDILSAEDATLLLYLADELPQPARQAIDARLATDASLQARLEAMRSFEAQMRGETLIRPVSMLESRSALNTSLRIVREQAIQLQNRPTMRMRRHARLAGIPRWAWGSAVAACLAVGLVVWISNSEPTPMRSNEIAINQEDDNVPRQNGALSAAFGAIEPEGSESAASEIDSQIEALRMLAVMNEME